MNPVQWTVDQFWSEVQRIQTAAQYERQTMDMNKYGLQESYTAARNDPDKVRGRQRMAMLDPLIHANSALRIRYRELVSKFNQAVNAARAILQKSGLQPPTLGQIEIGAGAVIGGVAVLSLVAAGAILGSIAIANKAQTDAVDAMISCANDLSLTASEREACRLSLQKKLPDLKPKNPFDVSGLVPVLGIVAVILIGPKLLEAFTSRRAA